MSGYGWEEVNSCTGERVVEKVEVVVLISDVHHKRRRNYKPIFVNHMYPNTARPPFQHFLLHIKMVGTVIREAIEISGINPP